MIEIDITSYTKADDYLPYQVPEVWLFKKKNLKIYQLIAGTYQRQSRSRFFPDVDLVAVIEKIFAIATEQGTGAALKVWRKQLET